MPQEKDTWQDACDFWKIEWKVGNMLGTPNLSWAMKKNLVG